MAANDGLKDLRPALTDRDWWRDAVVYQVYPRSFADSSGDGVGDIPGVTSHVDYLDRLGVDAVWMSPFYPSALVDGGYDIDDYRAIDPVLGTIEEFDELVGALHKRGIRVIVDIVPNHSSNRHRMFQEALAAPPGSTERDRYIFREGTGPNGDQPPSDWNSFFGGPAWTRVPDGQWYLHLFTAEQPDWNWHNKDVREEFLTTLRFWADRGVDGFRVDVAHLLSKNLPEVLPSWAELVQGSAPGTGSSRYAVGQHPLWDRDDLDEIYAEWRSVFDEYDPPRFAVAEAWVSADRRVRYASHASLGQAFNFDLLQAGWDSEQFRRIIKENLALAEASGSSSTWVFSNHDVVRHATRFGLPDGLTGAAWLAGGADPTLEDTVLGLRRARAATLLALALPGSMYLYQGEELGLREVGDLPADRRQDPSFFRTGGKEIGRDGSRVPLPWTRSGASFGFGQAPPHLPQPGWFAEYAVEAEEADPGSTLSFYRSALRLRHELESDATIRWIGADGDLVAFSRADGWASLTNFGSEPALLPSGQVLLASGELTAAGQLPPDTTVWLALGASHDEEAP